VYHADGKVKEGLIEENFGTNVNLGNIAPDEVISVETLRLGLRGDTLPHFH
jgi:phosphosulfolactate synthase